MEGRIQRYDVFIDYNGAYVDKYQSGDYVKIADIAKAYSDYREKLKHCDEQIDRDEALREFFVAIHCDEPETRE